MAAKVKVYCKDCEFLYESKPLPIGYQPRSYFCKHPTNLRTTNDWFSTKEELIDTPQNLNAYNNCPNFKQKGK